MGRKKKRAAPDPRSRIFCYYCDRTFNTEQELLMHQREKHLRCPTCNKRMLSVPSLTIHSEQMHNKTVVSVPNAIPGRTSTQVDVLGMKGVPEEYYLALEGKTAKKTAYQDNAYQSYPQQTYASQGYPQQSYPLYQGYASHAYQPHQYAAQPYAAQPYAAQPYAAQPYAAQPYGSQPYPHNYQQQPQHYTYPTQGQQSQIRAHHSYHYPSQHSYPAHGSQAHQSAYPQQTYGPKQPVSHSQPQQTPTYGASQSTYLQPTTATAVQPQTNGPRPVPDEKPPPLPAAENESTTAKTANVKPAPAATSPVAKPVAPSEPGITVLFDRTDLSMEEMRAQLPQYHVSSSN